MAEDRILDKVRGLLAQAEHPNTGEEEAKTFMAKAEALMTKHAIEHAMLADKGEVDEEITTRTLTMPAPYAREKAILLDGVARYHSCQVLLASRKYAKGQPVTLIGYPSDMDTVELLVNSLLVQATRDLLRQPIPVNMWGERENAGMFRSSWMLGFNDGVKSRMHEIRQREKEQADTASTGGRGAELVLASRQDRVQAFMDDQFGRTEYVNTRSRGSGRSSGFSSGRNADLNQRRFSGGQKALSH